MNNLHDEGVLTMNESIEKQLPLFAKSILVSVLYCICISGVLAADFLPYSLVSDGGSEKCKASRLDMDGSTLTITTLESDCIQGVVSDISDGSLIFADPSITSPTCTLHSLFIDGNDNISVITEDGCYDADLDDDGIPNRQDPDPESPEPNACSDANVYLLERTFGVDDRYSCRASRSINTDSKAIEVGDGADVLYMAPSIFVQGGFTVINGGIFRAVGKECVGIALPEGACDPSP